MYIHKNPFIVYFKEENREGAAPAGSENCSEGSGTPTYGHDAPKDGSTKTQSEIASKQDLFTKLKNLFK